MYIPGMLVNAENGRWNLSNESKIGRRDEPGKHRTAMAFSNGGVLKASRLSLETLAIHPIKESKSFSERKLLPLVSRGLPSIDHAWYFQLHRVGSGALLGCFHFHGLP